MRFDMFDLFRAYPGGILQLSRDSGVRVHTLYRLVHSEHRHKPVRVLDQVARVFCGRTVLGQQIDYDALARAWDDQARVGGAR